MGYFTEQLAKVMKGISYNYHGCRIQCLKNKYIVFGEEFPTLDEAKKAVDNAKKYLKKSIK